MKQVVSFILILLLGLQSFYSLAIYSFYYANKSYVATVLCENRDKPQLHCKGNCFLKKQLQKAEEERQNKRSEDSTGPLVYLVSTTFSGKPLSVSAISSAYPPSKTDPYSFQFHSLLFRPPCL